MITQLFFLYHDGWKAIVYVIFLPDKGILYAGMTFTIRNKQYRTATDQSEQMPTLLLEILAFII